MADGYGWKRAKRQIFVWSVAPLVALGAIGLPVLHAPAVLGLASFLLTLWQVHAAVSSISIVVFAFLLQTARVSRRSTVSVLALAIESGILAASAYALATTCAMGIALGLASVYASVFLPSLASGGVHTYPVLAAIAFAAVSNFVLVLWVLARSLRFLSAREIVELQKRAILQHVRRITRLEVRQNASVAWLMKNAEETQVETAYGKLAEGRDPWFLPSPGGRALADVNMSTLHALSKEHGGKEGCGARLLVGVGSVPAKGDRVLELRGKPSLKERAALWSALRWEKTGSLEADSLFADAAEEFTDAVRDGDIGRFKEGMELCVEVTDACLHTLDDSGLRGADRVNDLSAIDQVGDMLRFGLDEALKTRRDDFAITAGRGLTEAALVGFRHANRSAVQQFLRMYPFLRKVVLSLGLRASPVHGELYWRSLQTLGSMMMPILGKSSDPAFIPVGLGVVEETLVSMMRDSIEEGAPDFEQLLDAWRLTFAHSEHPRVRVFHPGSPVERPAEYHGHWIALAGWAFYLAESRRVDPDVLRRVLDAIKGRFGSSVGLVGAFLTATSENSDIQEVESWVLWSLPRGVAHGIDGRRPMVLGAIALILLNGGTADSARSKEEAAELHDAVVEAIADLKVDGSRSRELLVKVGVPAERLDERLSGIERAFEAAKKMVDDRQRAKLRAQGVDEAMVRAFEKAMADDYLRASLVRAMPTVFTISPEPLPPSPSGIGILERLHKGMFVKGGHVYGHTSVAESFAEALDRGEVVARIKEALAGKGNTVETLNRGELMERLASLCNERKGGLLMVRSDDHYLGVYEHPDFLFGSEIKHRDVFGTLAGVPIAYGHDLGEHAAVYLPEGAVRLRYAPYGGHPVLSVVETIDAKRAEETVAAWERDGSEFTTEERAEKVESLQEGCGVRLLVRSSADGRGMIAFNAQEEPETEP